MFSQNIKAYGRNDDVVLRQIAGEYMLVPVSASFSEGTLMMLSETGAFLWERLENSKTVEELVEDTMSEFEGDKETMKQDIIEFINRLLEIQLVIMEGNEK